MNNVEIAKKLLESKGYNVSKVNESEELKYISNLNGFLIYRKIENGKGIWYAKRQDDSDDKMFPITYQQARGFEEMPNPTEIEKLQRKLGKMLLPQDEGLFKKKSKAGDAMADLAKSAKEDADNVKATMEKFKKLNKKTEDIHITVPDDLKGPGNPKFKVTYSTSKGETTSQTIEATDEDSAKAIIRGRCKRTGKTPEFISIEKVSESEEVDKSKSKSSLKEAIRKAMTAKKEHIEVAMNDSSTTAEKVAYAKDMLEKLKKEWDDHYAFDLVDFLNGSMLLDKIPLDESKTMRESAELDYEEMKYWNPVAIGSRVAKKLGVDATEEELIEEIGKIINDDYSRGDVEASIQRALESAKREQEMEKDSQSRDPMEGHKYLVSGATPNVTETGTDYNTYDGGYKEDPKEAIIAWLKLSQEAPTAISIDTNKNANAQDLLQWVVDNEEEFRSLCDEYECPYKVDYVIDGCKQKLERPSNFETKYNYPDQIWPFAIG